MFHSWGVNRFSNSRVQGLTERFSKLIIVKKKKQQKGKEVGDTRVDVLFCVQITMAFSIF